VARRREGISFGMHRPKHSKRVRDGGSIGVRSTHPHLIATRGMQSSDDGQQTGGKYAIVVRNKDTRTKILLWNKPRIIRLGTKRERTTNSRAGKRAVQVGKCFLAVGHMLKYKSIRVGSVARKVGEETLVFSLYNLVLHTNTHMHTHTYIYIYLHL